MTSSGCKVCSFLRHACMQVVGLVDRHEWHFQVDLHSLHAGCAMHTHLLLCIVKQTQVPVATQDHAQAAQ